MLQVFTSFSNKRNHRAAILLGTFALLSSVGAQAQTTTFVSPNIQNFSPSNLGSSVLTFTPTVIAGGTGTTGYFTETGAAGFGAFGVADGNNNQVATAIQLDFDERTFAPGSGSSSPNTLRFDLASLSYTNGNGKTSGFADLSKVEVYISVNGAAYSATPQLKITGPQVSGNDQGPIYNFGGGTTPPPYSYATNNNIVLSPAPSPGISTVVIILPSSATAYTRVGVRIILGSTNKNQLLIDNVTLRSGNASPLPVELTRFNATSQAQAVNLSLGYGLGKEQRPFRSTAQRHRRRFPDHWHREGPGQQQQPARLHVRR
ncbi:hypothetical protein ACFQT0_12575 [Hymenobacter humi]|uniref:Uncharacterized protein n=1 Tax=Hymenobacter humi TaxID=1411620 RepID=A0ABW2U7R9_9BACT